MTFVIPVLLFTLIVEALLLMVLGVSRLLLPRGPVTLTINEDKPLEVAAGESLLNVLYGQEIYIPSACGGKGTCGYCKVTVRKGDTTPLATELEFLSMAERDAGVRLACQIRLMESIHIALPPEILSAREYASTVKAVRDLTPTIKEITFELSPEDHLDFACGQYVQVRIPNDQSPEGFVFRAYSIASPSTERGIVTLNVKLVEGGIGSTWLHSLRPGDPVLFTGPYGEWAPDPARHLVLIGGGVGMAPMRSIILSLLAERPDQRISLFFGARTESELLYHDHFSVLMKDQPRFSYIPALSDAPKSTWEGETGFIHQVFLRRFDEPGETTQAFLCGPPPMIDGALTALEDLGVDEDAVFYDKF